MKKFALIMLAVVFVGGIVLITGCDKDDISKPVITLTGAAEVTIDLGDNWVDPGVSATDDEDGDLTSKVTSTVTPGGSVNTAQVNTYTITYSVTDAAGNVSDDVTRVVKVRSNALVGTYAVVDVVTGPGVGTYNYTVTVTQSGVDYNKLLINNFGGFGTPVTVNASVLAANISIAAQSPAGMPAGSEGTISGTTGSYTVTGTNKAVTAINYTVVYDAGGTDVCAATYTKQ